MSFVRKIFVVRQPIQNILFLGFGGLTLAAVGLVLYIGLSYTTKLTKEYHRVLVQTAVEKLGKDIETLLIPVESQALWFSDQIAEQTLNIYDYRQVQTFLRGMLSATPNVTGAGIVYRDGLSRYILRKENKWRESTETSPAQNKVLFKQMEKAKTHVWGDLFFYEELGQTVVDLRTPIIIDGKVEAILILGVTVAQLSQSILETSTDRFLTPFILYGDDFVLAHPLLTIGNTVSFERGSAYDWASGDQAYPLPVLADFQDTILADLINGPVLPASLIEKIPGIDVKRARLDNDLYIVATKNLFRYGQVAWTIGVYINSEKSEETAASQLFEMAAIGLVVLILAVIFSFKIGRKMAQPIVRLAETAKNVRTGQIGDLEKLPRSRLRELDQAALAFNEMIDGLRERDLIREVFGRYVPESVATSLMQENGELKPVSTQATILFSDIEGFTALTEDVGPDRIVNILNSYFSDVVSVLECHGGVVTQFQGDAVLATFNVPIEDEDHALNAINAALEIRKMLCLRTYDGVTLKSRIGINTGKVVAGAVGAEGRLNYTVHGDAVNLASRIESLNKTYNTDILISENTAKLINFENLETIGETDVRGLSTAIKLYIPKT